MEVSEWSTLARVLVDICPCYANHFYIVEDTTRFTWLGLG